MNTLLTDTVIAAIISMVSIALGVMGTLITSRGATSAQAAQEWRELHNSNKIKIDQLEGELADLRRRMESMQENQTIVAGRLHKIDAITGEFVGRMQGILNALAKNCQSNDVDAAAAILMAYAQAMSKLVSV